MAEMQVSIFNGQISDTEVDYRDSIPVNMYHIPKQIGSAKGYLRSQWGLSQFSEVSGKDQSGIYTNGFRDIVGFESYQSHYRVSNKEFIEVAEDGSITEHGQIDYDGQCRFTQTFKNIAITTNAGCWLYNPTDGLRKIADVDLGAVFDTVFINQRLVHIDDEFIIVSDVGSDEDYSVLNYGSAEIDPDDIIGIETISNRLLVIGRTTIEWFADVGAEGFPYQRIESQLIESGCIGTYAKLSMNDENGFKTVYFLGGGKNDPVALRQVGAGNAPKLSTKEIDQILQSYTRAQLATAILENRTIEANNFIFIHLPKHTLSLDISATKGIGELAWTIQKSDVVGNTPATWINGVFDSRIGAFIYGDKTKPRLGKLDKGICTQYGEVVEQLFYTPILPFTKQTVSTLSLATLPGRNEANTEPVLFISSTTNGLIYSQENLISLGTQGDYNYEVFVRMNDFFTRPTSYKFRLANKQPVNVSGLTLDIL